MWYVYIARCGDDSLYTGVTTNLENRIKKHNKGCGSRYTRVRRPVVLVYFEKFENKNTALKREIEIKSWRKDKKESLIGSGVSLS